MIGSMEIGTRAVTLFVAGGAGDQRMGRGERLWWQGWFLRTGREGSWCDLAEDVQVCVGKELIGQAEN